MSNMPSLKLEKATRVYPSLSNEEVYSKIKTMYDNCTLVRMNENSMFSESIRIVAKHSGLSLTEVDSIVIDTFNFLFINFDKFKTKIESDLKQNKDFKRQLTVLKCMGTFLQLDIQDMKMMNKINKEQLDDVVRKLTFVLFWS